MNNLSSLVRQALQPEEAETLPGRQGDQAPRPTTEKDALHAPHPIAVALLIACCQRNGATREEILSELLKLGQCPAREQIRLWALACNESQLPPEQVFSPGAPSKGEALDCASCKNLTMVFVARHGKRKQYRFSCNKQHAILEAFSLGERVLLAPDSCNDWNPCLYGQPVNENNVYNKGEQKHG